MTSIADEGSCWGMFKVWKPKPIWETCDYTLFDFSPSGERILAGPAYLDGFGQGIAAVLDRDGEVLAEWRSHGQAAILRTIWEDDDHVLVIVFQDEQSAILRVGLDGSVEIALPPVPGRERVGRLRPPGPLTDNGTVLTRSDAVEVARLVDPPAASYAAPDRVGVEQQLGHLAPAEPLQHRPGGDPVLEHVDDREHLATTPAGPRRATCRRSRSATAPGRRRPSAGGRTGATPRTRTVSPHARWWRGHPAGPAPGRRRRRPKKPWRHRKRARRQLA